ncbi:hypothetical protein [Sneathiella chinensis]|nr:hypothetical protein [Sneathiella chinensis]
MGLSHDMARVALQKKRALKRTRKEEIMRTHSAAEHRLHLDTVIRQKKQIAQNRHKADWMARG